MLVQSNDCFAKLSTLRFLLIHEGELQALRIHFILKACTDLLIVEHLEPTTFLCQQWKLSWAS